MIGRVAAVAALTMLAATERPPAATADAVAYAIVEWPGGAVVDSRRIERLQQPVQPGSLIKIATLVTAFASGVASPDTRVSCRGEAVVRGHSIRCSHPRLRHPLRPQEALALSCNVWFATIGDRLPRARLDGTLAAMGLPPTPGDAPLALAATGLRARPSTPLAWLEGLRRVLDDRATIALDDAGRSALVEGLRGAALYGTASAFSDRGLDVAAKTGTTDHAGGSIGAVLAAWPARRPSRAIVLLAAGVAGRDAAAVAADIIAASSRDSAGEDRTAGAAAAARQARPPDGAGADQIRVGTPGAGRQPAIETMKLDDYVARVLAGEAAPRSRPAALEALALAARTFAVRNRGRHAAEGFDLCQTTHCQVLRNPTQAMRQIALATSGRGLLDHGRTADVYYTASCGGRTERPSAVWRAAGDPGYLPSKRDRACGGEPRWAAEIPAHDLERALAPGGFRGTLRRLSIDDRSASGRVMRLRLEGMRPDAIAGQDLRMLVGRTLGWHLLKSTMFSVRRTGGGYRFDGNGFGHGVGLCVLGSVRRAEQGDSTREIVAAYFPGLEIGALPALPRRAAARSTSGAAPAAAAAPGPKPVALRLVVRVPPSASPEQPALNAFATDVLDGLVRATGRPAPEGLIIVFHPSPESFRRETGESWWTAARTRGTRIDLLPTTVLRSRGTLESTLRHELAHVLTAPVLEGRPEWVREGVAMHFAGERPPASLLLDDGRVRRVTCPSDDDLRRPVSAAMARQAYGRAAACVARSLADGVAWFDVR